MIGDRVQTDTNAEDSGSSDEDPIYSKVSFQLSEGQKLK